MIRIKYIIICFTFFVSSMVYAQEKYTKVQNPQKEISKLIDAGENVSSVSCDFVQHKELSVLSETIVSEGIFRLKGNDKLLWEYHKPYSYKVVINGDKMGIDDSGSKMTFDTRSNRMFREISKIMIKSVDGSIIADKSTFETEILENKTELVAEMKPKTKELKSLFNKITLHFNKSNYLVTLIEMYEQQGDFTKILLKNQKLNEQIQDSVFDINR